MKVLDQTGFIKEGQVELTVKLWGSKNQWGEKSISGKEQLKG